MLRRPRLWFAAVVIWFVALFLLSHQAHLNPPGPQFDHRDKVLHAGYFTLGSACLFVGLALREHRRPLWRVALLTVLFATAVGALDEFHQSFVPNRSGNDVGDWLADTLGGFLGSALGLALLRTPWLGGKKQPCEP